MVLSISIHNNTVFAYLQPNISWNVSLVTNVKSTIRYFNETFMEPVKNIVIGTTLYLILYTVLSTFPQIPDPLIIGMFSLSPLIVIYMVFRVLTAGVASDLTFEEAFYEDSEYERKI